jgi:hypothetical protein
MPKKKPKVLAPDSVIPRRFRWLLKSKSHPGIGTWMTNVNLDMLNRQLTIDVIENQNNLILDWIASLGHRNPDQDKPRRITNVEELTLTTYDGDGKEIYDLVFAQLGFEHHSCPYDYSSNEPVKHHLVVSFRIYKTVNYRATSTPTYTR